MISPDCYHKGMSYYLTVLVLILAMAGLAAAVWLIFTSPMEKRRPVQVDFDHYKSRELSVRFTNGGR